MDPELLAAATADAPRRAHPAPDGPSGSDLDRIAADLADVEIALARLDAGTYFTDEVTGAPLPSTLLAERPTARSVTAP